MSYNHNNESHEHIHCGLCENKQSDMKCHNLKHDNFKGIWLVINSLVAFILPLVMAILASYLLGKSTIARFSGALLGLSLGIITAFILSQLILKLLHKKDYFKNV